MAEVDGVVDSDLQGAGRGAFDVTDDTTASMNGVVHGNDIRQDEVPGEKSVKGSVGLSELPNNSKITNGINGVQDVGNIANGLHKQEEPDGELKSILDDLPTEVQHITQGMFPFSTLISRQVQECWIGLNDLVNELADLPMETAPPLPNGVHGGAVQPGKPEGGQSAANLDKKEKILKWAGDQRAFFIKLLVLSGWSRSALEIHKAIDILNWLREQKALYEFACDRMGYMRRNLAFAQIPNPDLKTAAEVLSTGRLSSFPHLGYIKPKPLSPRQVLKTLRHINHILCTRLALHDQVPSGVQEYRVHDGRVTLTISSEFELDLSIAEDNPESQFYFVAFRFLFSPRSNIPEGRFFDETMAKVNEVLRTDGLQGCYDFLHDLTLSYKVNIIFKQALEMSRGQWYDHLRVELIHRTLVVQYWRNRASSKSWIEIGVKSGRRKTKSKRWIGPGISYLDVRWIRDGKETSNDEIEFDGASLSLERILRSVTALHSSHLLEAVYDKLIERPLYADGDMFLEVSTSSSDPSDCYLSMQITKSRSLTIKIEPITGTLILQPPSQGLMRHEMELNRFKNLIEEAPSRLSLLRCLIADHDMSVMIASAGWDVLPTFKPSQADVKRMFPAETSRYSFFRLPVWNSQWTLALTHSMVEDHWWLVESSGGHLKAQMLECQPIHYAADLSYTYFSALGEYVSAIIAQKVNSREMDNLRIKYICEPAVRFMGSAQSLGIRFEVPASMIPSTQADKSPQTVSLRISNLDQSIQKLQFQARIECAMPQAAQQLLSTQGASSLRSRFKNGICNLSYTSSVTEPIIQRLLDELRSMNRLITYANILASTPTVTMGYLSLSCFAIVYHQDPHARLLLRFPPPTETASTATTSQSLTLSLNPGNPQELIKHHLHLALTDPLHPPSTDLFSVLTTLQLTYPLLSVISGLQNPIPPSPTEPSSASSARFHILSHTPTNYTLHFLPPSPNLEITVTLLTKSPTNHLWVVRISRTPAAPPAPPTQSSSPTIQADAKTLKQKLRETIFSGDSNEDTTATSTVARDGKEKEQGWLRLDQGAAVPVGNASGIKALFGRILDVVGEFTREKKPASGTGDGVEDNNGGGSSGKNEGGKKGKNTSTGKKAGEGQGGGGGGNDVITLD